MATPRATDAGQLRAALIPINPLAMNRNTIGGVNPCSWVKIRLSAMSNVPATKPIQKMVQNGERFLIGIAAPS